MLFYVPRKSGITYYVGTRPTVEMQQSSMFCLSKVSKSEVGLTCLCWWGWFPNLLVFCLFACVFHCCSTLSSLSQHTQIIIVKMWKEDNSFEADHLCRDMVVLACHQTVTLEPLNTVVCYLFGSCALHSASTWYTFALGLKRELIFRKVETFLICNKNLNL